MTPAAHGPVRGAWDPAFAPLAEAFADEVRAGAERGALCVMRDGETLVDIHGGEAAPGRPWQADTLACCFSVTKGVLSLLAHHLIDAGTIALDTRIAALWPDFAAQGKDRLTLHDILTHRAGLPAVAGPVTPGDLYDWDRMTAQLAASAPVVPLGGPPVYHNMTYGHLLGEVLCRATGIRPLSRLLREAVTGPLAADFHLGLAPEENARCATLTQDDPGALFRALKENPDSLFARSMAFFAPHEDFNTPRWRGAEIGSGSGHATARAIATLYGQFVWQCAILSPARQEALRREQARNPADPILGIPIRYGQGVELSTPPALDFGPDPATLGHWGAGGAQGLADPATGLSFGYVTGHMDPAMGSSARCRRYIAALHACMRDKR
ncbi:MAG: beta-lactamase family protein [Rubellimicrobium sp.]|nr:beta-lactamase family protein [Rubellimicrobium sp.]